MTNPIPGTHTVEATIRYRVGAAGDIQAFDIEPLGIPHTIHFDGVPGSHAMNARDKIVLCDLAAKGDQSAARYYERVCAAGEALEDHDGETRLASDDF